MAAGRGDRGGEPKGTRGEQRPTAALLPPCLVGEAAVLESLCLTFFDDVRIPVDEAPILTAPRVMEQMSLCGKDPVERRRWKATMRNNAYGIFNMMMVR